MADVRLGSAFDKRLLRIMLALFLAALVVPTGVLVYHAYGQLKSEAFYQHRVLAEELAARVDARVRALMASEEARSLTDYRFLVLQGDARANFLQRSPLSTFPVDAAIPGLLAYFQIDAEGTFSSPLLPVGADPAAYGIAADEVVRRRALEDRVRALLANAAPASHVDAPPRPVTFQGRPLPVRPAASSTSDLARLNAAPAPERDASSGQFGMKADSYEAIDAEEKAKREDGGASGQAVFDRLNEAEPAALGSLGKKSRPEAPRVARKEQAIVPEVQGAATGSIVPSRVRTFEGELDPFVFRRLDPDHFVLLRKVWMDGQRLIQGAVIEQTPFVRGIVEEPFRETTLSQTSGVKVVYRDETIGVVPAAQAQSAKEELLYRAALPAPLADVEMVFDIARLPIGPGGWIIVWTTLMLAIVLYIGLIVIYRFGAAQIDLNRRQQDFVSAVSHELKTPLTSIRMYGEILRAGWASEEKKKTYYDFIFFESERLSRLITNVLRLARLTRNGDSLDNKRVTPAELLSLVESKVQSQVEQAGFTLEIVRDPAALDAAVFVDADSFVQILINLVDNALKFSARAPRKVVEIGCGSRRDRIEFWVRDYGPGIAPKHLKKIFELFFRGEDELTRETVGTGIGLALVHELTSTMGGSVTVENVQPGARFTVSFPIAPS
jgi:two-component system, OmpR family, phosphate regulon sensor histidine kinase PhoR